MEVEFNSVILTLARGVLYGLPGVVLGLLMVPWVLNARKPAVNTIAWILAIVALPYLGILLYTVFGHRRIRRRVRLKREAHYAVASGLVDV
ncbi:MAG: PLDc N-terminal domain-containing protein, partial [Myxococcota bacterium]